MAVPPRVSGLRLESTNAYPGLSARTPLVVCLRVSPRVRSPTESVSSWRCCSSWRVPQTRNFNSRSCTPPAEPSPSVTTPQVRLRRHPLLRLLCLVFPPPSMPRAASSSPQEITAFICIRWIPSPGLTPKSRAQLPLIQLTLVVN